MGDVRLPIVRATEPEETELRERDAELRGTGEVPALFFIGEE